MPSVASDPVVRHGKVRWLCDPRDGVARLRVDSDAFTALPLSIPNGGLNAAETTPAELLAVAYSAFVATDLAERLERNAIPARELVVQAWCRMSSAFAPRSVEEVEVQVEARVPGMDDERLRTVARVALSSSHKSLGMRRDLRTNLHVSLAH